jgi:GH43 family beta-xylosidase
MFEPIISAPAADPWMIFHQGWYYFCESRNHSTLHVRKARNILDIGADEGVLIWTPPAQGPHSKGVWAPELHFIEGKWFIYFAADDGQNEKHRMWVLESVTTDPQGEYILRGQLATDGWAIDGTILKVAGKLNFVWSGWPGHGDGRQNIYIAPMSNPWTISGARVKIAEPEHGWECVAMPICEGPQILQRDGRVFVVYSASGSWTEDYCLGMLELTGDDVLNPGHWTKVGPVFQKNEHLWGVGHCSFVQTPCQTEDWIVYHAKTDRAHGWLDRRVHAQRFNWKADGRPDFGAPAPARRAISMAA